MNGRECLLLLELERGWLVGCESSGAEVLNKPAKCGVEAGKIIAGWGMQSGTACAVVESQFPVELWERNGQLRVG